VYCKLKLSNVQCACFNWLQK